MTQKSYRQASPGPAPPAPTRVLAPLAPDQGQRREEVGESTPDADTQWLDAIAAPLDDAMGVGVFDLADPDAAQRLLEGRTPSEMRAIREVYASQTGRTLESDVARFDGVSENEMMANVLSGMNLRDQVEHYETSGSMQNLLQNASPEQLAELTGNGWDPSVLETLRGKMDSEAFMNARSRLFPDQRVAAVLERIQDTNGVTDDEGGAMAAFQTLSLPERHTFLRDHRSELGFLSSAERRRFGQMATSESEALRVRMIQATLGGGTDNGALDGLAADTGRLMAEQRHLEASLQHHDLPDGERAALQHRLQEMGDVRELVTPQRNEDGSLVEGSFLERLDSDVRDGRMHALMVPMGLPKEEVAKQQILDAVGVNDDERGIQEAFADVPIAERAALWDDPHVQAAMTKHLDPEELAVVESFRDNDVRAMSEERIRDGDGFFGDDERQILGAVLDMNAPDRQAFLHSELFIDTYVTLNPSERAALMESISTGSISNETGITAASKGMGTNEELLGLVSERTSTEDRLALRRGFLFANGDLQPQTPDDQAALALYRQAATTLRGEFDGDDYQAEMEALLAHSDPRQASAEIERSTAEGRRTASLLMDARADERMGPDGEGGGGFSALFSDTDETAQQAHQSQKGAHYEARFDGEVTESELAGHEALSEAFGEDHRAMIEAQNAITEAVATGTSIVAAIAVTLATSGAAGPAVAAFMAQYGAVTTGVTLGATRIATQELMGGDRYDTFGEAGATDAAMGVVDGATANLGGQAGQLFEGLVANNMADAVTGGAIHAMVGNVTDDQFWHQSVAEMSVDMGGDLLESLPAALRDGLIQAGVKAGMTHLEARRATPPSIDPETVRPDIQPAVQEMFEAGPNRWVPTGLDPEGEHLFQRGISGNYVNATGGMPETLEWLSGAATDDRSFASLLSDMSESDRFMLEVNNQYTSPLAVRGRADLGDLGDGRTGSLPAGSTMDNVSDIGMFENRLQRGRWASEYHRLYSQLSEAGLEINPETRGGRFVSELQGVMDSREIVDGMIMNYDAYQSNMDTLLDRYPMEDPAH